MIATKINDNYPHHHPSEDPEDKDPQKGGHCSGSPSVWEEQRFMEKGLFSPQQCAWPPLVCGNCLLASRRFVA